MNEIFANFGLALLAAVVFIYAVLTLLFNNFLHPLTIMAALPFSIGGALLGLSIGQKELGLFALIGVALLLGLVSKNATLLVDYALIHRHEGKPTYRAVVESGVARLRPILMTTIAMIAGMAPIALGIGAGLETRSPMAIAVVGGLITSTLLTLVVVPVIFTYVDGILNRSKQPNPAKTLVWEAQASSTARLILLCLRSNQSLQLTLTLLKNIVDSRKEPIQLLNCVEAAVICECCFLKLAKLPQAAVGSNAKNSDIWMALLHQY